MFDEFILLWKTNPLGYTIVFVVGLAVAGCAAWLSYQAVLISIRISMAPLKLYEIEAHLAEIRWLLARALSASAGNEPANVAHREALPLPVRQAGSVVGESARVKEAGLRRGLWERLEAVPAPILWAAGLAGCFMLVLIALRLS